MEEAASGTEKEIEIPRTEKCDVCGGSGAGQGIQLKSAQDAAALAKFKTCERSAFGTVVQVTACPQCRGKGRLIDTPCPNCHGTGRVRRRRKITVKIPAGIDEGTS